MQLAADNPNQQLARLIQAAKSTRSEGFALEAKAQKALLEAEQALDDYKRMREEYKARPKKARLLPGGENDLDYSAKQMRDIQDAKGDHVYYTTMAQMYFTAANAKFTKAAMTDNMVEHIRAHLRGQRLQTLLASDGE